MRSLFKLRKKLNIKYSLLYKLHKLGNYDIKFTFTVPNFSQAKSKKNMKLKTIILLTCICFAGKLMAQTNFHSGYVIKPVGDTLHGEIDSRGDYMMGKKCRFRNIGDHEIITYSPSDIIAYKLTDNKYFISKLFKGEQIFFELLVKGQVSIYFHKDMNGNHYYIDKDNLGIREITFEESIVYEGDKMYAKESTKHIGMFKVYMQDAPSLHSRINRFKNPTHKKLIKLATDYNNMVCGEGVCLTYKKKSQAIKVKFEIAGENVKRLDYTKNRQVYEHNDDGLALVNKETKMQGNDFLQYGVYAHVWLPRINEKLYLRTGLLLNKDGYKIPVQLEYVFPKWMIKPKFSYGINIGKPFHQSVGAMLGCNIDFDSKIGLSVNYEIDFEEKKAAIIPGKKTYKTLSFGLTVTL